MKYAIPVSIPIFAILAAVGGCSDGAIENSYLALDPAEEAPIHGLLGYSITYRIATGPRQGQKVFTLQTLLAGSCV